ncbi:MAG: hypothetical protein AAF629_30765 [Chloroflexota bacterium]
MSSEQSNFFQGPVNRVLCTIETEAKVDAAKAALNEAGFGDDAVGVLFGEEGLKFIDPDGAEHGFWGRLLRFIQHHDDDADVFNQAETALKSGHYAVGIMTDGGDEQREKAFAAVKPHAMVGTAIYYAGHGTLELLERILAE